MKVSPCQLRSCSALHATGNVIGGCGLGATVQLPCFYQVSPEMEHLVLFVSLSCWSGLNEKCLLQA